MSTTTEDNTKLHAYRVEIRYDWGHIATSHQIEDMARMAIVGAAYEAFGKDYKLSTSGVEVRAFLETAEGPVLQVDWFPLKYIGFYEGLHDSFFGGDENVTATDYPFAIKWLGDHWHDLLDDDGDGEWEANFSAAGWELCYSYQGRVVHQYPAKA